MFKKPFIIYAFIFFIFLIYHLITLAVSPVVWIDEITFNSELLDFIQNRTYHFTADITCDWGKGNNFYGPVYFFLNSFFITYLNNGIFQSRLLELIGGLLLVVVITKEYAAKKLNWIQIALLICIFLDPFLSSSMHRGRFDLLALLFFFISINYLIGSPLNTITQKKKLNLKDSVLSGLFLSLSLLTHIRLAFLVLAFVLIFLIELIENKKDRKNSIINIAAWGITVFILYSSWIVYEFGGYVQYYNSYLNILTTYPMFIGSNRTILPEVMPLFISFCIFLILIFLHFKKFISSKWILVCITMIISFFTLIKDTGYYSILVIPCFYLIIMISLEYYSDYKLLIKWIATTVIGLLFLAYSATFIFKTYVLFNDYNTRDPKSIDEFISTNIPSSAKVCTDEFYYYSVLKNKNRLHLYYSFQAEANPEKADSLYIEVAKYSRDIFDYDYLVVADVDRDRRPELLNVYLESAQLDSIARFDPVRTKFPDFLKFLPINRMGKTGYQGTIYKRKR